MVVLEAVWRCAHLAIFDGPREAAVGKQLVVVVVLLLARMVDRHVGRLVLDEIDRQTVIRQVAAVLVHQAQVEVGGVVGAHRAFDWIVVQDGLDELDGVHYNRWLGLDGAHSFAREWTAHFVDLDGGFGVLEVGRSSDGFRTVKKEERDQRSDGRNETSVDIQAGGTGGHWNALGQQFGQQQFGMTHIAQLLDGLAADANDRAGMRGMDEKFELNLVVVLGRLFQEQSCELVEDQVERRLVGCFVSSLAGGQDTHHAFGSISGVGNTKTGALEGLSQSLDVRAALSDQGARLAPPHQEPQLGGSRWFWLSVYQGIFASCGLFVATCCVFMGLFRLTWCRQAVSWLVVVVLMGRHQHLELFVLLNRDALLQSRTGRAGRLWCVGAAVGGRARLGGGRGR